MDMRAQIAASGPREAGVPARGWLVVALFFGLILAPAATQLAQLGAAPGQENRILAPPPQWVGFRRLRDFTKATDAYIDDHFGLRDRLVYWNSRLRYRLGASSTPKVVIGSDGWLFYAGEKIIEQHTGDDVFTPAELERWVEVMTANRDWLARRGIAFIITIAPDKSTIYPEKLPTHPRPPGRITRADQLVARLRTTDLVLVDPRQSLREAKRSFPKLYFEGDSHWTQRGAFIAYSQLMEAVRAKFPNAALASLDDYDIAWGPAAASDLPSCSRCTATCATPPSASPGGPRISSARRCGIRRRADGVGRSSSSRPISRRSRASWSSAIRSRITCWVRHSSSRASAIRCSPITTAARSTSRSSTRSSRIS
jgi:SGNH hydrolase-like domain, acetyltransferase AlgX